MDELYFVEYSPVQGQFHVEQVAQAIKKNQQALFGVCMSYIPVALALSFEEGQKMRKECETVKKMCKQSESFQQRSKNDSGRKSLMRNEKNENFVQNSIAVLKKAQPCADELWAYYAAVELLESYDEYCRDKGCVRDKEHLVWMLQAENDQLRSMVRQLQDAGSSKPVEMDAVVARKIFENEMMLAVPAKYLEICEYILFLLEKEARIQKNDKAGC